MAAIGQSVISTTPVQEKTTCATDPPWVSGLAAMSTPLTPPKISMIRPGPAAGRSARPVVM
jgi:hypothetical protein